MVKEPHIDLILKTATLSLELFPGEIIYYVKKKLGKIYIIKDEIANVFFNNTKVAYNTTKGECFVSSKGLFFTEESAYEYAEQMSKRAKIKFVE